MKKNISLIIALVTVASLASVGLVQAKGTNDKEKGEVRSQRINIEMPKDLTANLSMISKEDKTALQNETNLKTVITKGKKLIDMRLNTLNKMKSFVNNSKLTAIQKNTLTTMIDENINGLAQLKTKLIAETDLATAKNDVNSMFVDYRIYGTFMPKINSLRMLNSESNHLDKLQTTTFISYQAKIDALKASNGDTTLIASMEANLAKAKTEASTISNLIASTTTLAQNLKPADYPTQSKTIMTNIKTNLKTIHNNFKLIKNDLGIKGKVNVMEK